MKMNSALKQTTSLLNKSSLKSKRTLNNFYYPVSRFFSATQSVALVLLIFVNCCSLYEIETKDDALDYLTHFGYLEEHEDTPVRVGEAKHAIKEFQKEVHIPADGKLNEVTVEMMNMPRCGNRDKRIEEGDELGFSAGRKSRGRKKRHLNHPRPWRKRVLTYQIIKFASSSLKIKTLQNEIDLAFKYFERESNLTFKKTWDGKADIEISFVKGEHGDAEAFNGVGDTLAHAFYPNRGDIHFDDDEDWTADSRSGHNLRTVAVHEIGHALGLRHSDNKDAIMFNMYQGFKTKIKLHPDDINAIQSLYGPKFKESQGSENDVLKSSDKELQGMIANPKPDLCTGSTIDAISTLADGKIYIFKGQYYFRLDHMGGKISPAYPKLINETFKGVPSKLDTVLTVPNGKTYFFKGRLYWRSTGTRMDGGYPKNISSNFPGLPNSMDAAFVWSWNNRTYFFKKNRYWRFSFDKNSVDAAIYPMKIGSNWPGIPVTRVEDAFTAPNGRTYFFKHGEYWQFHDPDSDLEAISYPRSTAEYWFGCTDFKPDVRKVRHMRRKKSNVYI